MNLDERADRSERNKLVSRYLIIGNSGSGKSTLAYRLAEARGLARLDLDTLAWQPIKPPTRRSVPESARDIHGFQQRQDAWVIEGCYADLIAVALPACTHLLFLNPGIDACVTNALRRPWEPHKYESKEEQDASLTMLLDWIREYPTRDDVFGLRAHQALYEGFAGNKAELTSLEAIASFTAND
jgi:adenylate kinase family enzyme